MESRELFEKYQAAMVSFRVLMGQLGVHDTKKVFTLRENPTTKIYISQGWVAKVSGGYKLTETGEAILLGDDLLRESAKNPGSGN